MGLVEMRLNEQQLHELRGSLGAILNSAEILVSEAPPELYPFAEIIRRRAGEMVTVLTPEWREDRV